MFTTTCPACGKETDIENDDLVPDYKFGCRNCEARLRVLDVWAEFSVVVDEYFDEYYPLPRAGGPRNQEPEVDNR